jgi:hypothetical protein
LVSTKGVVLTKDNLAKKNWKGSQQCISCNRNENIQHLFFDCPFANTIWRIVFFATNLNQPGSIGHMFGTWLNNQPKKDKRFNLGWYSCVMLSYLALPE